MAQRERSGAAAVTGRARKSSPRPLTTAARGIRVYDVLDVRKLDPTRRSRVRLRTGEVFALSTVPQPLGGVRWFFVCVCGSRCAKLYLLRGAHRCRRCHRLAYPSQRMTRGERSRHMAKKLWSRIAVEDPETGALLKRPRVRWRTVERIADRAEEYERRSGDAPADRAEERPR